MAARRVVSVGAAVGMLAVMAAGIAAPAAAATAPAPAPADDWYLTIPAIASIHDQGITGKGIQIALIDEPVWLGFADLVGADISGSTAPICRSATDPGAWVPSAADGPADVRSAFHGTSMASVILGTGAGIAHDGKGIKGVAPDVKVISYTVPLRIPLPDGRTKVPVECNRKGAPNESATPLAVAIEHAILDGANIISMSLGSDEPPSSDVGRAIGRAEAKGVLVVASTGNDGRSVGYPAALNGVIAVGAADSNGVPSLFSNRGPETVAVGPGEHVRGLTLDLSAYQPVAGTSPAAAWTSGVLALAWSKYPTATGNQIIQSLIHTAGDKAFTRYADWGYGTISARNLVANDPLQYPDVNPLLRQVNDRTGSGLLEPTLAQVAEGRLYDATYETEVDAQTGYLFGAFDLSLWNPQTDCHYDPATKKQLDYDPTCSLTKADDLENQPEASQSPLVGPAIIGLIGLLVLAAIVVPLILVTNKRSKSQSAQQAGGANEWGYGPPQP